MPILILALVALAVFVSMGLMLFGATIVENRDRNKFAAAAKAKVAESKSDPVKARAAHA